MRLDEKRIDALSDAVVDIAKLNDPVGKIIYDVKRDNNLHIRRVTTAIGIIIFELILSSFFDNRRTKRN